MYGESQVVESLKIVHSYVWNTFGCVVLYWVRCASIIKLHCRDITQEKREERPCPPCWLPPPHLPLHPGMELVYTQVQAEEEFEPTCHKIWKGYLRT